MGTLPPKVTTQMPTTKPKPVCIYGEETHSIPFTGCKCPEGFEIDTTHIQMNGEDCCACNPLPTAPVITTTPPTHAPVCIEGGSKHTIPYENCRCPEGFKVDQSYIQVDGESCCKCDHIPTTQPSILTTKIPSKPPPVCIEGGEAHKIPFKGCSCPDDFQLDESHPQFAGKLCCKCIHVPTTLPPKFTAQMPTTKPKPVCIYGEETHSIPFTGCKCPEGFEIDTAHKQENGKSCCSCNLLPTTLPPKVTSQVPTSKPKPVCIYGVETHFIPFTGCKCPEGFEIDNTHKQENGKPCCNCNQLPTTLPPKVTTQMPISKPKPVCIYGKETHSIPFTGCKCPEGFEIDITHKQENGKPCCSCNQLPKTLPPKVTTQMPTTKPKLVCIYGEKTHSIPFTGCKCPEGFEIDTTHTQENGK